MENNENLTEEQKNGINLAILAYVDKLKAEGLTEEQAEAKIKAMNPIELSNALNSVARPNESSWSDLNLAWTGERAQNETPKDKVVLGIDKETANKLSNAKNAVQIEEIVKNSVIENSLLNKVDGMPTEQDLEARNVLNYNHESLLKEDHEEEDDEVRANVMVNVNPNTGEQYVTNAVSSEEVESKEFEDLVDKINNDDGYLRSEITTEDVANYVTSNSPIRDMAVGDEDRDFDLDIDTYAALLDIIKRKENMESFNVYRTCPTPVKKIIDDYVKSTPAAKLPIKEINRFKNQIAESIISDMVVNIKYRKVKTDFAKELDALYTNASVADNSTIDEKNQAYRDSLDNIEDPEKKSRMEAILNRIDDARDLHELKEFAKKCKIKKIEIEKYESRVFSAFLSKYKTSNNNIYDINMALSVLMRHMLDYNCSFENTIKFMVLFCKYVQNFSVNDPLDHAFMYYVLYNSAMLDVTKDKKFTDNVNKVILNIIEREGNK